MNIEDLNKKEPKLSPQEYLANTGHIFDIKEASVEDMKIADETEKAIREDSKYVGFADLLVKAIPGYLRSPIIEDDFKDKRVDRRDFKSSLSHTNNEAFNFYDKNKLAHHSIRNFFSVFNHLIQIKEINSELVKEASEIEEKVIPATPKYDSMSEEEKLEIVNSLTDLARRVCNEIIK